MIWVSLNFSSVLNDLHHGKHVFAENMYIKTKYGEPDSSDAQHVAAWQSLRRESWTTHLYY